MMVGTFRVSGVVALCIMMTMSVSCSIFRQNGKDKEKEPAAIVEAQAEPAVADPEAQLRDVMLGEIAMAERAKDEKKTNVIRKKPYFFKEWVEYPDSAESDMRITVQEKDRHSTPYIADVTVPKQRFVTRFHLKRVEAEQDASFLRESGTETVTFEMRNGKWTRVGSMFVADSTEENVNGEWVPLQETARRTVAAEEEKSESWFKRTWATIVGK